MRHAFNFILVPILLCIGIEAQVALADTLELKTGERVEGTFKQASVAGGVVIEIGGQAITMPFAKVRAIYIGAAPTAAPTVSAPPTVSVAQEALDALMELQTVTTAGISYRDYSARMLDVKIRVDRYLRGNDGGPAKPVIGAAMRYYELASQAWSLNFPSSNPTSKMTMAKSISQSLRTDASLNGCAALQNFISNLNAQTRASRWMKDPDGTLLPFGLSDNPGILWSCGSSKIAEAEQLLKDTPEIPSAIFIEPELPKSEPKKPGALVIQGGQ